MLQSQAGLKYFYASKHVAQLFAARNGMFVWHCITPFYDIWLLFREIHCASKMM
jgi:hypothetical protein